MINNDVTSSMPVASQNSSAQVYTDLNGMQNLKALAHHDKNAALKEVAHQFESVMVQMMMKSMRQANAVFSEGNPLNSNEGQMYQDMFDNQLSISLTQGRGMGIAAALLRQIQGRYGNAEPKSADATSVDTSVNTSANTPAHTSPGIAGAAALAQAALDSRDRLRALGSLDAGITQGGNGDDTYEQMLALMSAPESSVPRFDASAMLSSTFDGSPEQFVSALMPVAETISAKLGVDSRVLLSQAALETGWGEKVIHHADGSSSFNFFNIKADSNWRGAVVTVPTVEYRDGVAVREQAAFRAYNSPQESFSDYAQLISNNPRYQHALASAADPRAYVQALQRAGYATDPHYAQKVLSVLASDSLQAPVIVASNADAMSDGSLR